MKFIDDLLKKYGSYRGIADAYGETNHVRIHGWHTRGEKVKSFMRFFIWARKDLARPSEDLLQELEQEITPTKSTKKRKG